LMPPGQPLIGCRVDDDADRLSEMDAGDVLLHHQRA
jgi:hypothetical protein